MMEKHLSLSLFVGGEVFYQFLLPAAEHFDSRNKIWGDSVAEVNLVPQIPFHSFILWDTRQYFIELFL